MVVPKLLELEIRRNELKEGSSGGQRTGCLNLKSEK